MIALLAYFGFLFILPFIFLPVVVCSLIHHWIIRPYCRECGYSPRIFFVIQDSVKENKYYRKHAKHPVYNWATAHNVLIGFQFVWFIGLSFWYAG